MLVALGIEPGNLLVVERSDVQSQSSLLLLKVEDLITNHQYNGSQSNEAESIENSC
jgi:hypothetical protein